MAYTKNTPQATQTIAFTQPLIQDNFDFLETGLQQEHNFNASGTGSDMYHLKVSMPNQADPGALPAGTNGQYYVSGGIPKFDNGTAFQIQLTNVPLKVLTGTVALNTTFALKINPALVRDMPGSCPETLVPLIYMSVVVVINWPAAQAARAEPFKKIQ